MCAVGGLMKILRQSLVLSTIAPLSGTVVAAPSWAYFDQTLASDIVPDLQYFANDPEVTILPVIPVTSIDGAPN